MKKAIYIAVIATAASTISLHAQNMHEVMRQIVVGNPDLASKELTIKADRLVANDENALSNPEVSFGRVWGKDGVGNKLQLDVVQSFDWPGLYHKRSQANAMAQTAAMQQLVADKLELAFQAKQLLTELVYVRKQIALVDNLLEEMEKLTHKVSQSLSQGEITILDEKKVKYEAYKYKTQKATLVAQEQDLCAQINALAGNQQLSLQSIQEYELETLQTLAEYKDAMIERDPALQAGKLASQQEELSAKAAKMSRMPSFSVGYQHQAEMGDRFNGFTVGMSLPFFENRHGKTAQKLKIAAIEKDQEQSVAENMNAIESAYANANVWKEQMAEFRSLFGDNSYLMLLDKAFQGGEMNVIDYLNECNYYKENTLQYLDLEYNYFTALSMLNKYSLLSVVE